MHEIGFHFFFLQFLTLHKLTHTLFHTVTPTPTPHHTPSPASQNQPQHGACSTRPCEASSCRPTDGKEEMDKGEHGKHSMRHTISLVYKLLTKK